jgi:hypothetical protein
MVSTFPAERKIIKNNVLAAEVIQIKNEIDTNFRIIRIGIKKMQVSNNSNDEKWDNNLKIYFNLKRSKADIAVTRVESARKKDSKILLSSAIRMMKKK